MSFVFQQQLQIANKIGPYPYIPGFTNTFSGQATGYALGDLPFKDDTLNPVTDGITDYICFGLFLSMDVLNPDDNSFTDVWTLSGSGDLRFSKNGEIVGRWKVNFDFAITFGGGPFNGGVVYEKNDYTFEVIPGAPQSTLRNPSFGQQDAEGGTGPYFGIRRGTTPFSEPTYFIASPWYRYTLPVGCTVDFSCDTVNYCSYGSQVITPAELTIWRAEKPVPGVTATGTPYYTGIGLFGARHFSNPAFDISSTIEEAGMYWQDEKGEWHKEVFTNPQIRRVRTNRLGLQTLYFYCVDRDNVTGWQNYPYYVYPAIRTATIEKAGAVVGAFWYNGIGFFGPVAYRVSRLIKPAQGTGSWGVRNLIQQSSFTKKYQVYKIGQTAGGKSYILKQFLDPSRNLGSARLGGPCVLTRNDFNVFQGADWEDQDGIIIWNDPNIVWTDFIIGGDKSGLSVALFLMSSETDAVQTWQLKFKRADKAFGIDSWPADEDAVEVMTPENGGINFAAVPFSLLQADNQELFILAPGSVQSYHSQDGGKRWNKWG